MKLSTVIKAAGRELGMRRAVYPNRVAAGKMRAAAAAEEIASIEAIHAILKAVEDSPEIRARLAAAGINLEPEQPTQTELL